MTYHDIAEPVRTSVQLTPTNNPLGEAVAGFVLAFNSAVARDTAFPAKIDLRAFRVENDPRFSDHILIDGFITEGENAGVGTTQQVVVHTAPPGLTKHTVRFLNFGREEEKKDMHFGQIGMLVQEIVAYILTGDMLRD
jgi:hypothetical protein